MLDVPILSKVTFFNLVYFEVFVGLGMFAKRNVIMQFPVDACKLGLESDSQGCRIYLIFSRGRQALNMRISRSKFCVTLPLTYLLVSRVGRWPTDTCFE